MGGVERLARSARRMPQACGPPRARRAMMRSLSVRPADEAHRDEEGVRRSRRPRRRGRCAGGRCAAWIRPSRRKRWRNDSSVAERAGARILRATRRSSDDLRAPSRRSPMPPCPRIALDRDNRRPGFLARASLAHPDWVVTGGADCVVVGGGRYCWRRRRGLGRRRHDRRRRRVGRGRGHLRLGARPRPVAQAGQHGGGAHGVHRLIDGGHVDRRQRRVGRRRGAAPAVVRAGPRDGERRAEADRGRCGEERDESRRQPHVVNFRVPDARQRRALVSLPPRLR